MSHEYAFDVKLFAAIRVRAETEAQARKVLEELLDCASVNFGAYDGGDPIVSEVALCTDDGPPFLYELDGEPT